MKAIFCPKCHDIVLLTYKDRKCRCGDVHGKYLNNSTAITNGKGIALAIGNGAFDTALFKMLSVKEEHNRAWYVDNCKISHVWFRPHTGPGNPHSFVKEENESNYS